MPRYPIFKTDTEGVERSEKSRFFDERRHKASIVIAHLIFFLIGMITFKKIGVRILQRME